MNSPTIRRSVMKTFCSFTLACVVMVLTGCDGREKELEKENARLLSQRDSVQFLMQDRERYFDEIVSAINEVHVKLEDVRVSGEQISVQTEGSEGTIRLSNNESRQNFLSQIGEIDHTLAESREEIRKLEARIAKQGRESSTLTEMINNLKQQLGEREQQIAMLEQRVTGLEGEVAHQTQLIVQRDSVIHEKQTEINTAYYVVGTRSELEEMGIISDEGGFLWGLFGATAVLSSGVDEGMFRPLDKTTDHFITVDGEIEEIIPKRSEESYVAEEVDEQRSNLQILNPKKFWRDRYLVIVRG
jgi:hypothetical protein